MRASVHVSALRVCDIFSDKSCVRLRLLFARVSESEQHYSTHCDPCSHTHTHTHTFCILHLPPSQLTCDLASKSSELREKDTIEQHETHPHFVYTHFHTHCLYTVTKQQQQQQPKHIASFTPCVSFRFLGDKRARVCVCVCVCLHCVRGGIARHTPVSLRLSQKHTPVRADNIPSS